MGRINLYTEAISQLKTVLKSHPSTAVPYSPALCAPQGDKNAILFRDETAYELGGGGKSAVCGVAFAAEDDGKDEVILYGRDLCEIETDAPYAHFTVIGLKYSDENTLRAEPLKEIGFSVFQLYPEGFHVRISPSAGKEQARVAKAALKKNPPLSFINVGCSLIRLIKAHPDVSYVKTIFVTLPDVEYPALAAVARKMKKITDAVESTLALETLDCASCKMKPICDEVDGLRELHFQQSRKEEK